MSSGRKGIPKKKINNEDPPFLYYKDKKGNQKDRRYWKWDVVEKEKYVEFLKTNLEEL